MSPPEVDLSPLDGDHLDYSAAKTALSIAGAPMWLCGVKSQTRVIYSNDDERLVLNRNVRMYKQPIVIETIKPVYLFKSWFYVFVLAACFLAQYMCHAAIYRASHPHDYLAYMSAPIRPGLMEWTRIREHYLNMDVPGSAYLAAMLSTPPTGVDDGRPRLTFLYLTPYYARILMALYYTLPTLVVIKKIRNLRLTRIIYSPHALSCLMSEYARGTNLEVVRNTASMRYSRLASLPICDSLSTIVMHGTIAACEALVQTQSFFTTGAALLRQPCSIPTLAPGRRTQKVHVLRSCPYRHLRPDSWRLVKRALCRTRNVASAGGCFVASIMVLFAVMLHFVAIPTIQRLLSMA
jgi:hypothetical protein